MKLKILLSVTFLITQISLLPSRAQVKIGTNSTNIEATSNFEIEASTAGRKMKVDKTTGQITIADGTQEYARVLTSDANGNASWKKIGTESLTPFPSASLGGAKSGVLENGVTQIITFPNLSIAETAWIVDQNGLKVLAEGKYLAEASFTMENSEGCTGSSLMSLAVSPVINDVVYEGAGTLDRLTPVYSQTFKYKVTNRLSLIFNNQVKYAVKATIVSPQDGCTTKITSGSLSLNFQR